MKKSTFNLTNKYGISIFLSLEPEGTIYELHPEESIEIEIFADYTPSFDLQINKDETGLYLSIWQEGEYQILRK